MILIYIIDKNVDEIQLFSNNFVWKNKYNCYLLVDGKQKELCVYLHIDDMQKEKNKLEIMLVEEIPITDMSDMFSNCKSLISLPDVSEWNTSNVTNMNHMFSNCSSLISLPDISKWNTSNVNDMSLMFSNCKSLISLPDISKWNTSNVTEMDIDSMFFGCK